MTNPTDIIDLSRQKWQWMSERDVAALDALFHADAVFVHRAGKQRGHHQTIG